MPAKALKNQLPKQRLPRQARAIEKVELILEAAVRLLERDGIEALTTNALAETAGVSIGTLYQYFKNKDAVLAALTEREMTALSARVLAQISAAAATGPGGKIRAVMHAVLATYGGRRRAHRLVMAHAIAGGGGKLAPLFSQLMQLFTSGRLPASGQSPAPLSLADAYVLTHAVAGVLRTVAQGGDQTPPREQIELSLTKLVRAFLRTNP